MKNAFQQQRANMLDCQIKPFSVIDPAVLAAFDTVEREAFLPAERRGMAYLGEDLPMGPNGGDCRFLLEAPAHARLLQEAGITPTSRVLDIGCLSGYSTAILAELTPYVVGVDSKEWVAKAKKNLEKHEFVAADLTQGAPNLAPYDVIVINGAVQQIPASLADQLKEGGVIATFWRSGQQGHAVLYHKQRGALRQQVLFDAFVPMLPGFEQAKGFSL